MNEIEVKILNIHRLKVEESLLRLGAVKIFDGEASALFFDFKDCSIAKSHSVIRLRKEGDLTMLTFKKVLSKQGAKVAQESSVEVSDLFEMKKILENLGLSITGSTQKRRSKEDSGRRTQRKPGSLFFGAFGSEGIYSSVCS